MKDFLQKNFPELLLTLILLVVGIVLICAIHWHDSETIQWCQNLIGGIVLALTAVLNSLKAPHASGPNSTVTSTESVKATDPNAKG